MESLQERGYNRVILKLSGQAVGEADGVSFDRAKIEHVSREIAELKEAGVTAGVVIGGGNIVRGRRIAGAGVDHLTADTMGMFATVINGLVLADGLRQYGVPAEVFTAVGAGKHVREYSVASAKEALARGLVVLSVGGTGNPLFTTDMAAALRAVELDADALLKGTKVDGIYTSDPQRHKDAKRLCRLSYDDVLDKRLEVMDMTAVRLCMTNNLPIVVFDVFKPGNLARVAQGEKIGTVVGETDNGS